jgi:hypothetical protein
MAFMKPTTDVKDIIVLSRIVDFLSSITTVKSFIVNAQDN